MRVAVDVMGGDHAPDAILLGCWQGIEFLDSTDEILLVGDEPTVQSALAAQDTAVCQSLPALPPERLANAVCLVEHDGPPVWGFDVLVRLLRRRIALRWAAEPLSLTPVRWFGRRAYASIAARRNAPSGPSIS